LVDIAASRAPTREAFRFWAVASSGLSFRLEMNVSEPCSHDGEQVPGGLAGP